ncbi:MAG: ATP-binding cassette domain-containing protein [Acidimicrobiia bacterium]|nr:ATP-binding cassette domain-containing protein [Acidimicrobiia bacterium]MDX2467643.1 ATP-binding cassette domain-containing protein [Acidimicrobiia bacterium]
MSDTNPPTTTADSVVIRASNLHKTYGDTVAVDDLSFSVEAGKIIGLLGPNGAGKTTTINMLTTLASIDSGTATVAGFDVAASPHAVRQLIGLAGQSAAVDEKLTARENLQLFGRFYKMPKEILANRVEELVAEFRMGDYADRPAETYSGGQRRRLDVVAALVANPPALFLDEPTTGLDPRSRVEIWDAITDLAANGAAIVLTTQYLDEADKLADEILLIDQGNAVARGTPEDLKRGLDSDVLDVRFPSETELDKALDIIDKTSISSIDRESWLIRIPVTSDARSSLSILRRIDDANIDLVDYQLRRPTLDDVFLALTDTSDEGSRR